MSDAELERIYDYPQHLERPWVQSNFVSSADGAATLTGTSRGLSSPADQRIFGLGRDLADVVLVGAGTALGEGYGGVRATEARLARRKRLGRQAVPPLAVVSSSCAIPAEARLLRATDVAPWIFTAAAAPEARKTALRAAGAEVIVAGEDRVELAAVLHELDEAGLRRVNCEGGPRLFASMLAGELIDELCLTVSPLLTGAGPERVAAGDAAAQLQPFELVSVLHEDGSLMLRYRKPPRDDA